MKDSGILVKKNYKNKSLQRPSYYMRPIQNQSSTKLDDIFNNLKLNKESLNKNDKYNLNVDKIKTLEEAKEILKILNIKIHSTTNLVVSQCNDVNKLIKYIEKEDVLNDRSENNILLTFKNGTNRLIGKEFGRETFYNQIDTKLNYQKKNIIIFSKEIEDISMTFVQGLIENILLRVNKYDLFEYFEFKGNKTIIDKIHKTIYL